MNTFLYTIVALVAFAGNSVLCRLALEQGASVSPTIDPASFTALRLISGMLVLFLILSFRKRTDGQASTGSWRSGIFLFLYAVSFSFAYSALDTGTGALILFASVQLTMIGVGLLKGGRLSFAESVGFTVAFCGLLYLMLPGAGAPSAIGFLLMVLAGGAWGLYSVSGQGSRDALGDTAFNFARTVPFVCMLFVLMAINSEMSADGIVLAALSGGLTSGLGYTIWFLAVRGLSNAQAAAVQLLVPVIAAAGGVLFVGEVISQRLVLASLMILGGVGLVVFWKGRQVDSV